MSSARPKVLAAIAASALVAACAGTGGSTAPAKTSNGIWMGTTAPHPVQPLADKPRFGKPISEADLAAWNIDIRTPDGQGLPAGSGTVSQGQQVYAAKCAACHGADAKGGNAASLIFSLYGVFGSCVTSAETGVVLQNRGAYFSLDPKHPNRLEPGKVPLHTLIASLAFRDDRLWAALGCMGADGQPQIHLQTYIAMIDFGQNIQQALAGPRWLSGRFGLGEARDTLHIEARYPRATIEELVRRGHPVDRWGDWNELAGHANGITIENGIIAGGADPRSDGAAVGY